MKILDLTRILGNLISSRLGLALATPNPRQPVALHPPSQPPAFIPRTHFTHVNFYKIVQCSTDSKYEINLTATFFLLSVQIMGFYEVANQCEL